jgi:hypothetical protein
MRDIIFFVRANYIMGDFKGYFDFFNNLRVKKVEAPSKYPEKWPIMYFAQIKKKIISLIF